LDRVRDSLARRTTVGQRQFDFGEKAFLDVFRYVVKPRESLFQFGGIGTVLTEEPLRELNSLFAYYVERQFTTVEEFREALMTRRLTGIFKTQDVLRYYHERQFGDERYHVTIPFVHETATESDKAIKPLDLDKQDTMRIIEYGDRWRMRIERLRAMNQFPRQMLFVVRENARGRKHDAAEEVRREFDRLNVQTVAETDQNTVIEFARAV
jgi:hypothetical protein